MIILRHIFIPGNCKPYPQPPLFTFYLHTNGPRQITDSLAILCWGRGGGGGAAFRVPILRLVGCTCFPSPASYKSWAGGVVSRSTPIALSPLKALLPSHNLIYWLIICSANALPLVQDPALDHNAHQPWGVPFCFPSPLIYSRIFVFM